MAKGSLFLFLLGLVLPAAAEPQKKSLEDLEAWHQNRIANLTKADGWLSLAGLHWLQEGLNSLGPDHPVTYRLEAGRIWLISPHGLVRIGDQHPTEFEFDLREPEGKTLCQWGSQSWYVIQRDGRWVLRIKDSQNPPLLSFQGIPRYPPDPNGWVDLDFNRSYNPPCAFTDFATCPRPPASNRLPFSIEAGEKAPPAH